MPGSATSVRALITAEHASRRVPDQWRKCFEQQPQVLSTHRAWDAGTGALARKIASQLDAPCLLGGVTRLLVDLNRPSTHPNCFSAFSSALDADERQQLLKDYHHPHWQRYLNHVAEPGRCLHLACHSFTPVLDGQRRTTDIGLLFDPRRMTEARWSHGLLKALRSGFPSLRIHANQPYRGTSSGLGQSYRSRFSEQKLTTVEIEINGRLISASGWPALQAELVDIVADYLA